MQSCGQGVSGGWVRKIDVRFEEKSVGFVVHSIEGGMRVRLTLVSIVFLALSFMKTTFEAITCQTHATSFKFEKATKEMGGDGGRKYFGNMCAFVRKRKRERERERERKRKR